MVVVGWGGGAVFGLWDGRQNNANTALMLLEFRGFFVMLG